MQNKEVLLIDTYRFCILMYFSESAVISGIVPLTGNTPPPSENINSCRALAMIQKDFVVGLGVIVDASFRRDCTPLGMEVGRRDVFTALTASSKFSSVSPFSFSLIPKVKRL